MEQEGNPSEKSPGSSLGHAGRERGAQSFCTLLEAEDELRGDSGIFGVCFSLFVPHVVFLCFRQSGSVDSRAGRTSTHYRLPWRDAFSLRRTLAPSSRLASDKGRRLAQTEGTVGREGGSRSPRGSAALGLCPFLSVGTKVIPCEK